MLELVLGGLNAGIAVVLRPPLLLPLCSVLLALMAIAVRQQRERRASVAETLPQTPKDPANSAPLQRVGTLAFGVSSSSRSAASPPQRAKPELLAAARARRGLSLTEPEARPTPPRTAEIKPRRKAGLAALPTERIGLSQISLRTSPGYRRFSLALVLMALGFTLSIPVFLPSESEPSLALRVFSLGLGLLAAWHGLWAYLWRLDYDSIGLSSRNRWLRSEARMWRALTGISSDGPFITLFHFADGTVMRVPSFISGRREMMQTARRWLEANRAED